MKEFKIILAFLFVSICAHATSKTVNLANPGTLGAAFTVYDDYLITGLTVTGPMDYRDFYTIQGLPMLETIDISGANITAITYQEKNYLANEIPDYAFYNRAKITAVSLPNSITKIGWYAFNGCTALTTINIPTSLSVVGYGSFWSCTNLNNITLPVGLTSIEDYAFNSCSNLTAINLPATITSIKQRSFENCSSLTTIDLPNLITSIESGVFTNCTSLSKVTIPNSVTIINQDAFSGCKALVSITLPESVVNFGPGIFANCKGLLSIELPPFTKGLGGYTFNGCVNLTSVKLPNTIQFMGDSEFEGCSSLNNVVLPTSITKIGGYMFYGCSSLEGIVVPDNVTSIGEQAFMNCTNIKNIKIPSTTTSIGSGAFANCSNLVGLWVDQPDPSKITLGQYVFSGINFMACFLIVPPGSKNLYATANQWSDFVKVKAKVSGTNNSGSQFQSFNNIVEFDYVNYAIQYPTFDFVTAYNYLLETGIRDVASTKISMFPSIVKESVQIAGVTGKVTVQIYDMQGKLAQSTTLDSNEKLNVKQLPAGTYLLKVKSTSGIQNLKFIKQ